MSTKITKTKTKTKTAKDRPVPPALAVLAARIDEQARREAGEMADMVIGSLNTIKGRLEVTTEIIAEIVGMMDEEEPKADTSQALVEFAREKIINRILKEGK